MFDSAIEEVVAKNDCVALTGNIVKRCVAIIFRGIATEIVTQTVHGFDIASFIYAV